jgi:hypothetical protein
MATRLLLLGFLAVSAACASAPTRQADVRIRVVNGARYPMAVRVCAPAGCSDYRMVARGARTTFAFRWTGDRRHVVLGKDHDRVAIQVPIDFTGPGRRTVTLVPPHHPQESAASAGPAQVAASR